MRRISGWLRIGTGTGNPDCGRIPNVCAAVHCGVPVDRLRRRYLSAKIGGMKVKIVVWKAPKMLRGILARFFKIEV